MIFEVVDRSFLKKGRFFFVLQENKKADHKVL